MCQRVLIEQISATRILAFVRRTHRDPSGSVFRVTEAVRATRSGDAWRVEAAALAEAARGPAGEWRRVSWETYPDQLAAERAIRGYANAEPEARP